ncbi:electron transfer flavoprotein subunit alpha/FixB family protein [Myxococcus sp. MISCRS1]|jgi:electron transfer flavoprotein alpha subunit|uniref:electron transfer flavoprotein subunit alpha/FixB family protein n=1 Tax=Myxococcus TaxID=32 RepID=UPI001CBDA158|nr:MULTISPECIES: electron transfer flavoprotein subunit alpha/FixB family protein [unclassified Myxococcus]MBZ4394436.1 electron transfer flavoprotein subunit alpha/FixB family protein [Myxococcus sp. AS-1-15]MCY1001406.1 electron transfer flavoprotein subunit alpha/FixB family protein [Myxococcus sp. MISCRS1]BDT37024.1 electron transfer flavoprotein subunit alpha/FixB family protein [Myxococcus sp. MH1]
MPIVLIVAEQQPDGNLRKASLNAITAGKQLADKAGAELHIAILGKDPAKVAEELKGTGAKAVHVGAAAELEHYLAETYAPALAALATELKADFVGMASTAQGKDLMPRLAARLKAAMATDITGLGGSGADITFHRPMWAGNVFAEVKLTTPVKVFTVRATEFTAAAGGQGAAEVKTFAPKIEASKTKFVEFKEVKSARPELTEARVVVSGGRGTKGDFKEIEALADDLGAAVGASRAVCDAGWVPNDLQVGQTGKVVAPALYIAAGISGAIQHLAGMKSSKTIVAINKDAEAPIFQVADYGIVADLFKVLPELRSELQKLK